MQTIPEIVFFLHLCKAFDIVNKGIILSKLFTCGLGGLTHQLLRSYLENRQQYVTINSTFSSTSSLGMDVPQGSNSGPLHFLMFVNDNVKSSSRMNFNLFANDTSIYLLDCDELNLYNIMNA